MKHIRRAFLLLAGHLAILLALGMSVAPASAGPLTHVLVDDDGKQCATPYRTIQSAIDAAVLSAKYRAKTVTVCEGTYPEQVTIAHVRNLTLEGLPGAVITPPAAPFTDSNLVVSNSRNIYINTLTIDGGSRIGPDTGGIAIGFWGSTGRITGNTVMHWRTPDLEPVAGRLVGSIVVSSNYVRVRDNVVSDFLGIGIQVAGFKNRVTNNHVEGPSHAGGLGPQYGVRVLGSKSVVNLNTLISDARVKFPGENSIGIQMGGHKNSAKDNTITGWGTGVMVSGGCSLSLDLSESHGSVQNNAIRETFTGVLIKAYPSPDCDAIASQNRILNNLIENASVVTGTRGIAIDAKDPTPAVAPFTRAQLEEIRGNHITHMAIPFDDDASGGGIVSYTFTGNVIVP